MSFQRTISNTILVSAISALAATACGEDEGPGSESGVKSSKALVELSDAEKQKFCDWGATGVGAITCPNGFVVQPEVASICVQKLNGLAETCQATVAQGEICAKQVCDGAAKTCLPNACAGIAPAEAVPAAPTATATAPSGTAPVPVAPASGAAPAPAVPASGGAAGL